jgi:hypothetical protein
MRQRQGRVGISMTLIILIPRRRARFLATAMYRRLCAHRQNPFMRPQRRTVLFENLDRTGWELARIKRT